REPAHSADRRAARRQAAAPDPGGPGAPRTSEGDAARNARNDRRAEAFARRALHFVGQRGSADDAADVRGEHADIAVARPRRDPSRAHARYAPDLYGRPSASGPKRAVAGGALGRPLARRDTRR